MLDNHQNFTISVVTVGCILSLCVCVCTCRWETLDSFMQHDVQELCRVVSFLYTFKKVLYAQ